MNTTIDSVKLVLTGVKMPPGRYDAIQCGYKVAIQCPAGYWELICKGGSRGVAEVVVIVDEQGVPRIDDGSEVSPPPASTCQR